MKSNLQERDLIDVLEHFEPLLTAEQAAAHLLIHPKTLMRMARNFQIPAIRIGKYWRFRLSALDEWVAGNENHSSQPFA
jgi:excisionase family DNA binding protein